MHSPPSQLDSDYLPWFTCIYESHTYTKNDREPDTVSIRYIPIYINPCV